MKRFFALPQPPGEVARNEPVGVWFSERLVSGTPPAAAATSPRSVGKCYSQTKGQRSLLKLSGQTRTRNPAARRMIS